MKELRPRANLNRSGFRRAARNFGGILKGGEHSQEVWRMEVFWERSGTVSQPPLMLYVFL